jgi:choline-sulfatase
MWELPARTVEPGETALQAALRELLEETGLEPEEVVSLGEYQPDTGRLMIASYLFYARCRPRNERPAGYEEMLTTRYLPAQLKQRVVRREFRHQLHVAALGALQHTGSIGIPFDTARPLNMPRKPNVLLLVTDQQRFDTIAAMGNSHMYTPSLDRLVARGVAFTNAYSTCPVCVPARSTLQTGCEPRTTRHFCNGPADLLKGQPAALDERCGPYLAQVMLGLGYRTFGIGKFDTLPWNQPLGFELQLHSEELYASPEQRQADAYASWIAARYPEFEFLEGLMGERTDMFYTPQTRPLPALIAAESWAADRAVEQVRRVNGRPFFGLVSFVGPHPPVARRFRLTACTIPIECRIPSAVGWKSTTWTNRSRGCHYAVWADEVSNSQARAIRARYYGEITYIDQCIGRILDAVEQRPDADNTLISFLSDHGDHLGDHAAWQKESFFDVSCRVAFLLSWPAQLAAGQINRALTSLADVFGIATFAGGAADLREGWDVLGLLCGALQPRSELFGY